MPQKKFLTIGILFLAILIVMFLAAGISSLEFQPGPPAARENPEFHLTPVDLPAIPPIWGQIILVVFSVLLPIAVVLFIKYSEFRKLTYRRLIFLLIYGLLVYAAIGRTREEEPLPTEIEEELVVNNFLNSQRDAATFVDSLSAPNSEFEIIVDILIILLTFLFILLIYKRFFQRKTSTSQQLKVEAEGAIDEIRAGENLRNVIIRCYADMNQILNDARGIQRGRAMTPREFELELQEVGIPNTAVHRLTRLFEAVRYGNADLGQEAEQEAIQCLSSIAEVC